MEACLSREPLRPGLFMVVGALVLTFTLWALGGCVRQVPAPGAHSAVAGRGVYQVHFTVSRLKDHSPLASVSIPLRLGEKAVVRTDLRVAAEDKPALPAFTAILTTTQTPGLYQLVTKVAIRETARNKKGKLKVSKRNLGALLPVRLGVTETASPDGDPIEVNVRVDHR